MDSASAAAKPEQARDKSKATSRCANKRLSFFINEVQISCGKYSLKNGRVDVASAGDAADALAFELIGRGQ